MTRLAPVAYDTRTGRPTMLNAPGAWVVAFTETAPAWKSVARTQRDEPDDRDLERLALAGDGTVEVTPPTGWTAK